MTGSRRLLLGVVAVWLSGCAGAAPGPRPGDFPLRASDQPPFVVSWRLTEAPGDVGATGVLDIDGYADRLADAKVELVGLDADGGVVSRGIDLLGPRGFAGDATWPFRMRLAPTGRETRYAVRVYEFNWKVEPFAGR
jgi:hypothetical protein